MEKGKEINPLLRYDRNKVKSLSVDRDQCTITLTMETAEPLTIWFHSLGELNEAYTEWGQRGGWLTHSPHLATGFAALAL